MVSRTRRKFLVAGLSMFVPLALAELVLRLADIRPPPPPPPVVLYWQENDELISRGEYLHESAPRQLWRPRPGAEVPWGVDEHINAAGYRGPALAPEKSPGTLRIATLGDSSTFGFGVPWRETYSAKLVEELAKRDLGAEVIDAGVIGFTVEQGIERYQELVRALHPDVVTLAFGAGNENYRNRGKDDREKIAESIRRAAGGGVLDSLRENLLLVQWLACLGRESPDQRHGEIGRTVVQRLEQEALAAGPGQLDWRREPRVTPERFEETLTHLVEMAHADGACVILVSMPRIPRREKERPVLLEYNAAIERVGARLSAPVLDWRRRILAELESGTKWEELFLDDFHPNSACHAMLAAALAPLVAPSH